MTRDREKKIFSILVLAYIYFSRINLLLFKLIIVVRKLYGKEHPKRFSERLGEYSIERPPGRVIWFNAVSVGETLSLLPIVNELLSKDSKTNILITTTTVTSAEILQKRFPKKVIHQFTPVDNEKVNRDFLNYWQPDAAVWCESELWPSMINQTKILNIPMYLINARISKNTLNIWRKVPNTVRWALTSFEKIFCQTNDIKETFLSFGVHPNCMIVAGSTKEQDVQLSFDVEEYKQLLTQIADRHVWVAASTHSGEEEIILNAHKKFRELVSPNSLLILVPRHPYRGDEVERLVSKANLVCTQRSRVKSLTPETQVYLADTVGEMGLWFALSQAVFVGGSLVKVGGHNPYEPIAMNRAILTGPFVANFDEVYERLRLKEACLFVENSESIFLSLKKLIRRDVQKAYSMRARNCVKSRNSAAQIIATNLQGKVNMRIGTDLNIEKLK